MPHSSNHPALITATLVQSDRDSFQVTDPLSQAQARLAHLEKDMVRAYELIERLAAIIETQNNALDNQGALIARLLKAVDILTTESIATKSQ